MAVYTVHKFPILDSRSSELDQFIFIREGISMAALFIPPLWLLWHRMWTVFLLYVFFALLIQISYLYFPILVVSGIALCLSVLFALEGNQLRRWTLSRKGWQLVGVVSARNLEECESKFFNSQFQRSQSKPDINNEQTLEESVPQFANDDFETRNDIVGLFPSPVAER